MNTETRKYLEQAIQKYPWMTQCQKDMCRALEILEETYKKQGIVLLCGNGGSSSDADHIVAELMKSFLRERPISPKARRQLGTYTHGEAIAKQMCRAIPALNLAAQTALCTAIANDISFDMVFAQQVYAYGGEHHTLFAISTSGRSVNVLNAAIAAKAKGMRTIGLTGRECGEMNRYFDVLLQAPAINTCEIQEMHVAIYHTLCAMLEEEIFGQVQEGEEMRGRGTEKQLEFA